MMSEINRTVTTGIRWRPHEREQVELAARAARMRVAEFVRTAALAAARHGLTPAARHEQQGSR
jgi:uncharacterized protein (DUF1778 family)